MQVNGQEASEGSNILDTSGVERGPVDAASCNHRRTGAFQRG